MSEEEYKKRKEHTKKFKLALVNLLNEFGFYFYNDRDTGWILESGNGGWWIELYEIEEMMQYGN